MLPKRTALAVLHARFDQVLPVIRKHAEFAFRHVRCPQTRADKIAETIGICWRWFGRLHRRGKNPGSFITTLALRASQAVKAGRRVTRMESKRCVLAERTQHLGRASLHPLPQKSTLVGTVWAEALTDNHITPPPDAAAFRIDWPEWLATLDQRRRQLVEHMALGERTQRLAQLSGLSQARVSQYRREFHDDWERFCEGETAAAR